MTARSTGLDAAITAFIAHQRALGRGYGHEAYVLERCRRFVHDADATDLDQPTFDRWCETQQHLAANTRRARQRIVRMFCLYRRRTKPRCFVPDRLTFARQAPYQAPVLITPTQVARLLTQATALSVSPSSPLRGSGLRMALVLLYTAGLRRGEVTRLTLDDVDAGAGVMRIRESKFHKSRQVPLSPTARAELRRYLRRRFAAGGDQRPTSPLLSNRHDGTWRPYTGAGLGQALRALFKSAHVRDADGRLPRVHDLRHSFAVHALIRLYRRGADVQVSLPKLSMYMGHVSIVSTAYYLHLVPTVAALAGRRFERYCGHLLGGPA
ncbi:MAG: integrase [Gemmatimonas sp.]|jgi:site-specific recombinase XerD|nr:integrase [Gemmatimonas sp.]